MVRYVLPVALVVSSILAIVSTVLYAICKNTSPTTPSPSSGNVTCPSISNLTAASNWTGPDWSSFPTDNVTFDPQPGPEPTPRPITDLNVIQLVKTTQEQLLLQYDAFGTIACLAQGDTANCKGPWLNGQDWNNQSLSATIFNTTAIQGFECSANQAYLSVNKRVFYGFTSDNVTDSLQSIAHSTTMFAVITCTFNSSCAQAYNNDTAQMYYDYRNYINSTFFNYFSTSLSHNGSLTYCPRDISSPASIFSITTTPFDGGKEYFGLHDAIFIPGVAQSINGTIEEAKKEYGGLLGKNGRKSEGVFLNMVYFTYGSSLGLNKRSEDGEVYPGCKRRTWIIDGKCEGVIPPRLFDLAGTVVPMKERDRLQVISELSGKAQTTDLVLRDANCDQLKQNIVNSILNFQVAKADLDVEVQFISGIGTIAVAAVGIGGIAGGGVALLGGVVLGFLMSIAACEAFNNCPGYPPALMDAANDVMGKLPAASGLSATLAFLKVAGPSVAKLIDALTSGASVAFLGLYGAKSYAGAILNAAIKFNQDALKCCGNDCASAVCQQAATGCLLDTGSFWGGSESVLNCAAT